MARWGIKPGDDGSYDDTSPKLFLRSLNAVKSSKTLKKSLLTKRCLILADGFYCWKLIGKNKKVPYRIIPNNKKLICFAGFWEDSRDFNTNTPYISFILITRTAYKPVNELNGSMPVIIEPGKELKWIEGENMDIEKIIEMMEMEDWALLKYYTVSPRIENKSIDKPDLIKPAPSTDQLGNLTLFD
jgi:putative SOS response-associated peptidase YedK